MIIKGKFFDGKKAAAHQAVIYLELAHLRIESTTLDHHIRWPYQDVRISHKPEAGQPLIVQHAKHEDARIMIEDGRFYEELTKRLPKTNKPRVTISSSGKSLAMWLLPCAAILYVIYWSAPHFASILAKHFPDSWEESLGQYAIKSITHGKPTCTEQAGQAALSQITSKLLQTLPEKPVLRVKVVKEKTANAFAAPGGHIVIFSGLIDKAESPEEVAGVIAHEMGHVIKDHATQTLVRVLGLQLILTATFGGTGDASTGVMIANELLQLQHSREFEREADMVAAQILLQAGIDNAGMIRFFDRMNNAESSVIDLVSSYISTHPSNDERIKNLRLAQKTASPKPAITQQEWLALKAICKNAAP
ncbi:MAG: M48 family metallopeptidase [Rickettsiales bacterium]|jgi:predicted Zn-dependent protease|nr:M48 family metallopeptidase [Rickettsiales bacterium]